VFLGIEKRFSSPIPLDSFRNWEIKQMQRIILALGVCIILAGCAGKPSSLENTHRTDPQAILGTTWQWEGTTNPVEKIIVPEPERFTVWLGADGRAQMQFDCNRGGGAFEISPGKLSFDPLMSTRMACPPDSLDNVFMRDLQRVTSFFLRGDRLYLELPYDSGTMKFRPQK
jgi:heat shock protein HslJ